VKYVGIDISEAAITKALTKQDDRTHFIRADAENYTPAESFDALVFNESLYYFTDPLKTLERYMRVLKERDIAIVSTYVLHEPGKSILELIRTTYPLLDEVRIKSTTP
jgi:ubiquinone/menaquinone biosynthesis C-methylase UbiE